MHGHTSETLIVEYGVPQGSVLGPLLFLLYINDIVNCSKLGEFILFADDTNIFVTGSNKKEAYTNANELLSNVHNYMLLNKLHINMLKCYYMHFKPRTRADHTNCNDSDEEQHTLLISDHPIKKLTAIKFLGITIDENLDWGPHIKDLKRKLNYAIATLSRIKSCVPENLHKDLYYTLFESHLAYCISVWGGIPNNKMNELHIVQKKCIRVLFGDYEAYIDKFKTCVRARPMPKENQILGDSFYKKEHTKPLFKKHTILTVQNLYTYHCFMETLKILKFRAPISIYSHYKTTARANSNLLVTPDPSPNFFYKSAVIWNSIRPKLSIQLYDLATNLKQTKSNLKKMLFLNQHRYDEIEWIPTHDFDHNMITKL